MSGLGLSASAGSARSSSAGGEHQGGGAPAQAEGWRRPRPTCKAMWRRRRVLRRQQEAGPSGRAASPSSSEKRQIPPDLYGMCFRCFEDGHRRQDCTNDPLCIRCGRAGHVSSQCQEPRSPISAEELRRAVIAKVARKAVALHQAPAMRRRLSEPRQSAPVAPLSPVAPNLFPMTPGAAPLGAPSEICVLQRSEDMDDLERRLQLAVVMYVGGARPPVSCEEAAVAIAVQLDIPRFRFSVHKSHPEDFLVLFASHEFRNKALAAPSIEHQGFKLFIKPWLRQAQATSRLMRVQVDIMIEGVPSHAWSKETAAELLGSACLIDSLAPETASREDLSLFKLRAWCVDPDDVPVFRRLWVPEPPEAMAHPGARRASFRQLLEYPTFIHIGRMRDFMPPELWRRASGSDGGSGQSGLPDGSSDASPGGDWVVQPWARGVRDNRGVGRYQQNPATGGGGGMGRSYRAVLEGRVGPPNWRLSHMSSVREADAVDEVGAQEDRPVENPRSSNAMTVDWAMPAAVVEIAGERGFENQQRPATEQITTLTLVADKETRPDPVRIRQTGVMGEPLVVASDTATNKGKEVVGAPEPPLLGDQRLPGPDVMGEGQGQLDPVCSDTQNQDDTMGGASQEVEHGIPDVG